MSKLRDKFEKWYRDRKYRKGKFHEVYGGDTSSFEDENFTIAFKILKGKYKGVAFGIGTIHVNEKLPDGSAKATFDITIIEQPENLKGDLTLDDKFNKISGDILLVVLEDAIKMADQRMDSLQQELNGAENEFEEDRADYFEEPVQKRTVRKKNASVSKKRVLSRKN